jgi:hypothetical protein
VTTYFRAVYERNTKTLRPLEKVDLPDGELIVSARPVYHVERLAEEGLPVQETLADVLGFDPDDEKKMREAAEAQYQAYLASMRRLEEAGLFEDLAKLPPSDSDLDAMLYNEND